MTPDKVIDILRRGNEEFVDDRLTIKNYTERLRNAAGGQHPVAVILACMDSRIPVEDIFHCGIGDIFVVRIAGNIVNADILGSMEFACKVAGAKLAMVLGHGDCNAVRLAIGDARLGHVTGLLDKIKPAVARATANFKGEAISSDPGFVDTVCRVNVGSTVDEIRMRSPILKEMEDKSEIGIVGAMYDMHSGKVEFFYPEAATVFEAKKKSISQAIVDRKAVPLDTFIDELKTSVKEHFDHA